jgi:hypothetical protein
MGGRLEEENGVRPWERPYRGGDKVDGGTDAQSIMVDKFLRPMISHHNQFYLQIVDCW